MVWWTLDVLLRYLLIGISSKTLINKYMYHKIMADERSLPDNYCCDNNDVSNRNRKLTGRVSQYTRNARPILSIDESPPVWWELKYCNCQSCRTHFYLRSPVTYVTAVRPLGNVQSNTRLPVPNQMANTVIVLRLAGKTRFLCTPTAISKLL